MVEEIESEEMGRLVSSAAPLADARSSLAPRKKLLASLDQRGRASPGSSSSASSVRLRNHILSSCHVCNSRINSNRGKGKLQTLDSQWRIVLLCNNCFDGVRSAKICSYCFTEISEVGVICRCCGRRVHGGCISKYRGFGLCSKSDSFTCIDCWVPKSLNGVSRSRNPNESSKIVPGTCSVKISRALSDVGDCSRSLEDAVKDANSTAETKTAAAARARERALKKAVVARRAAEMAEDALDLAMAAARKEIQSKDSPLRSGSVADDTKLAVMLHPTINSSPRISKNLCSMESDHLVDPELRKGNPYLLSSQSDPVSHSVHGELQVCTDHILLEDPDKAVSEPSVRIGSSDHGSSIDLGVLEPKMKVDTMASPQVKDCKENGEAVFMGNVERGLESSLIRMPDCNDDIVELPEKEQASCSIKVTSGNDIDSGPQFYQKQEGFEHKVLSNNRGAQCQSLCDEDSSTSKKKICHGPDMYLRKYSKRCTSLKAILDWSSRCIEECKENGVDGVTGSFMLHRTMNSSLRISKNLRSMESDHLVAPELRKGNHYLLASQSDPVSHSVHGELQVCTDHILLENPDKAVSEPSVRIGSSDHGSSIDLGVLEPKMKVDTLASPQVKDCKENGEDVFMGNFERGLEASLIRMPDCNDDMVELPKKEQASCSLKVTSGYDKDSGSQFYQKQEEGFEHKVLSNNRGTQCQSLCDEDSSTPKKKRCHGPDMYLRKYSKRHTSLKAILDRSSCCIEGCEENGVDSVMGNFERGLQASLIRMTECKDCMVELPAKEQKSCSIKVTNSSGNDIDSGSQYYQKQEGLERKVSPKIRGTHCQSACDEDTSILERERCRGPKMYLRKYSKRDTSLKAILDGKTKFPYEYSPLESQASTPGLPLLQLNCSKVCRTFSDASFQSPSVPLEASACQSGHQDTSYGG